MRIKPIFTTFLLSIFPVLFCRAQENDPQLPALKPSKAYSTGRLANGLNYYFANNPTGKGLMDISLVQKMDSGISEEKLDRIASECFFSVKSLSSPFRDFLTRNGIAPTEQGYFTSAKGSVCYNFRNISSALPESVLDSTLLAIFDLAKLQSEHGGVSEAQAIVIAGDFDNKVMLAKMRLLSMITPRKDGQVPQLHYVWNAPSASEAFRITSGNGISKIETVWREARIPAEYMNTILPVISDKLAGEMGCVVKRRLEPALKKAGLNAWTDYRHCGSAQSPYDDSITLTVNCTDRDTAAIKKVLAEELTRLRTWGVDAVEYTYARDIYHNRWRKRACVQSVDNVLLRDKCISAFLYNASLAEETDKIKFAYRNMPEEKQTELFNDYMRRLLAQNFDEDRSIAALPAPDTREVLNKKLDEYLPSYSLKAPKDKTEPITGGTIWTFPNKVNVIHKKMQTNGISYFSYASKGNRDKAEDDRMMSISGIDDNVLMTYLEACGIDIKMKLTPADARLEGNVVKENLDQLLRYICAVSTQMTNKDIYGSDNYKLLVIVDDRDDAEISSMLSKYIAGFRPGSNWLSGKKYYEDYDDGMKYRGFIINGSTFPLDRTGGNKALADIAACALHDAVVREFGNIAVYPHDWSGFADEPADHYRLLYGVRRYKTGSAGEFLGSMSDEEIGLRLKSILTDLASTPVSKSKLETYKGMAKNRHDSYTNTAEYYINIALDRYLDNKNFGSRYPLLVNGTTAQSIQNFYAAAADSDK